MSRIGAQYPGGIYIPGGRDWQFRWPRGLERVLRVTPSSRLRQLVYLRWPIEPRRPGTTW